MCVRFSIDTHLYMLFVFFFFFLRKHSFLCYFDLSLCYFSIVLRGNFFYYVLIFIFYPLISYFHGGFFLPVFLKTDFGLDHRSSEFIVLLF